MDNVIFERKIRKRRKIRRGKCKVKGRKRKREY
jgi:hypothetical protein